MPAVLREHGLVTRLGAEDFGKTVPPITRTPMIPIPKFVTRAIHDYSLALAERIQELLEEPSSRLCSGETVASLCSMDVMTG
jgi:hypothetical protein